MKRILGTVVMVLLAALTLPSAALAVDMEFYTYGGFEAVVSAFTQLTLIFGNSAYQSLYYTVVVAGIGFGAAVAYIRLVSGSSGSILGWAPIAAVGIAIYIGLFVPKGNLAIYDPVYNKFQIVPNVPDGVVIVAGAMNAIERGLVEIISNSTDPDSYQSQAGGKGYLGLYMLTTTPITANNAFLDSSVDRYMEDCVAFALDNPASTLTIDELRKTTTSFSASIAKASNAAIPTVYYNAANPTGVVTTCNVAWNNLVIDLTQAALQNNITATCSSMGYDTSDAPQLTQCQTMLYNIQSVGGLGAASLDALVRQVYLYNRLDQVFRTSNSAAAANHQFLLNASGTMKAANEWIPILRAVLTAIVVALIPFLTIFLPTPICGRSMGLMFGLFVWLTTWGICDAITHKFAISYATKLWLQVRQNALGMDALYFFPSQTVKILAMFGTLRMGGLMLATGLTGVLVKFGGSVMGMLAGNMMGQIQSAGISGGAKTEDIAGRAGAISSNTTSMPTLTWANHHSLAARGGEALARLDSGTSSFETMSGVFGGTRGVSEMMANANTGLMTSRGGAGAGMREYGLPGAANASQFNAESGLHQTGITAAAFDFNSREHGATAAAPMTSVANVASHLTANGIPTSPSDLSNAMHNFQTAMGYGRAMTVEGMTGTSGFIEAGRAAGTGQGFSDVEKLKHADQVRAAANHAMPSEWKANPALYDVNQKSATPLGVATFIGAMQGVGIRYATEHGVATVDQRSDGVLSRSAEVGTMPAGDRQDANKFAQQLDKAGLHHEAAAVRALAKSGGAFGYGASYDSHGHVAGASAERGGVVTSSDKSITDRGRLNEYTNLNRSTTGYQGWSGSRVVRESTDLTVVDKGLRSTIGTFMKSGYSNESFNVTSMTGAKEIDVEGKKQLVQGEWFYGKDSKNGKDTLIGGSFRTGMDGNLLMFKQGSDGALHYAQVQGKYDSRGKLIAGDATEITRTEFVEAVKDKAGNTRGLAVTNRAGSGGTNSVAVSARGGKHVDMSSSFTGGTSVINEQTLAGSAAQKEFNDGNQLGVGTSSEMISIGERSIEVTADKISQVSTVGRTAHDPTGRKSRDMSTAQRTVERSKESSERSIEQVKRDSMAKTTRTLQHQSKTSNLPKSGGPAPRQSGKR